MSKTDQVQGWGNIGFISKISIANHNRLCFFSLKDVLNPRISFCTIYLHFCVCEPVLFYDLYLFPFHATTVNESIYTCKIGYFNIPL